MFFVYFFLFVIFNGKLTVETALFGAAFAALFYAFSCKYMGYSVEMDKRFAKKVRDMGSYGILLISEIMKANLKMIRMILTPNFEPEPQLVQFDAGMEEVRHRVALADSITLTPGTITCELKGDRLIVHCLDRSLMEGLDNSCFVQALQALEKDPDPETMPELIRDVGGSAENSSAVDEKETELENSLETAEPEEGDAFLFETLREENSDGEKPHPDMESEENGKQEEVETDEY